MRGLENGFGDIISKKFGIYYDDIVRPDKLAREFRELNLVALDLSCSASPMGHQKNRYANIFPYDKNRVILDIDAEGSDYINASFIDVKFIYVLLLWLLKSPLDEYNINRFLCHPSLGISKTQGVHCHSGSTNGKCARLLAHDIAV